MKRRSRLSPVVAGALCALLLPSGGIGFFQTDPAGSVVWPVPLPPPPLLVGQIVFLEWAIADAVSSSGFSVTSARKIVFW